jgi:hypothetical protein
VPAPALNDFIAPVNFSRFRGDGSLSIPLVDPDTGGAFDPDGHVLIFTVKVDPADEDLAALVQKISSVGGITVANPSVVALVPADFGTDLLLPNRTYFYDVQAQPTAPGAIKTVASGTLKFRYDVTRGVTLAIATNTSQPGASVLPAGGTTGQVLKKTSDEDFEADWGDEATGGPGSGLTTLVTFPAATADAGAAGEYATSADELAIYVAGTGWVFFQGYQK